MSNSIKRGYFIANRTTPGNIPENIYLNSQQSLIELSERVQHELGLIQSGRRWLNSCKIRYKLNETIILTEDMSFANELLAKHHLKIYCVDVDGDSRSIHCDSDYQTQLNFA